ncbi:hypothetical protein N431DRAFT_490060 [Stipitochalara longipes BDJ]|nr:hypothetical protein N431DRAFT_490060 [Stipitochalara longipes BDJ]
MGLGSMRPSKFRERVGKLIDKLIELKLKVKIHAKVDELLRIELDGEDLVLDPELQDKAFDMAVEEVSDRMALMFAKEIVKQLKIVREDSGAGDNDRRSRGRGFRASGTTSGGRPGGTGGRTGGTDEGAGGPTGGESGDTAGHGEPEPEFLHDATEIHDHLSDFIGKNLGPFEFDENEIQRLAAKVAAEGTKIQRDLDLTAQDVMWLAGISLYDIVFLCDDSGSMKIGDRIPALIRTLQSITAWATLLEPSGVSVRFLNYSGDMNDKFDNLSSQEKIANIVYNVKLGRYTRLGTALQEKILEHRAGRSKPLIAVIITDGEPEGEDEDCLRENIINCKARLEEAGKMAGMVFIIFQVGKSKDAQTFLNSIEDDEELEGLVFRSTQPVDGVLKTLGQSLDNVRGETGKEFKQYKKHLLKEFIGAMLGQTQSGALSS